MTSSATRRTPVRRRSRLTVAVIGAAAWTVLLVGLGSLPQAAAQEDVSPTDVRFATLMVPHHQMGIELAQMAIDKATTPGIRELAEKSLQDQQAQLPILEEIAASGSQPHEQEEPLMTFNEQDMAELESLTGQAFDKKWLDVLSSHHMAAIMMTDTALPGATSEQAKTVMQEIHDGQLEEIATMNQLREQVGGSQVSEVPTGAAETGGGSAAALRNDGLIATGAGLVVLGLAGGTFALRRRASAAS